ncbi:MAG: GGDEF domain-containing protein [Rhodocyclales bacterium CG_4_9_14_3_um_filter_68_10]|nr:MAG: GGDEF domain-containing protein [Rhodocyclales bacterium CG_4_9_14_3_um_filter_68_10]
MAMRYEQSKEESGELLRLAIPRMARHPAAFSPLSYAVWYEYLAGINRELAEALDAAEADRRPLDDQAVAQLYRNHIEGPQAAVVNRLESGFDGILKNLGAYAAEFGSQASRYDDSLGEAGRKLGEGIDAAGIAELVHRLVEETRSMRGSVTEMEGRLKSSRGEMEGLRQKLASAREEALTDALTGLRNRRGFDLAAADILAGADGAARKCSMLMVDIDHFKRVNDTYGHLFGDKVIRSVGQVLAGCAREQDVVARTGGEEFALLLPASAAAVAESLAETVRRRVEQGRIRRLGSEEAIGGITVSLGAAQRLPEEPIERLMGRADEALYASKRAGRNRVSTDRGGPRASAA